MAEKESNETTDDLRPEYDASTLKDGVRGKYYERFQQGTNLVLLEPDVAKAFPTQESVNEALRTLMRIAQSSTEPSAA